MNRLKIKSIVAISTWIIILVFTIHYSSFWDRFLLLNEKQVGYTEYLSLDCTTEVEIPQKAVSSQISNLVINGVSDEVSENGYSITVNEDGSITFSGTNNGKDHSIRLGLIPFNLPEGEYKIFDGGVSSEDGLFLYLEGLDTSDGLMNRQVLAKLPDDDSFEASSEYTNYWFGIRLKEGFSSEELTIYPMISKDDHTGTVEYAPCYASKYAYNENTPFITYLSFPISKVLLSEITAKDFNLFVRNIKYSYATDYEWVTLDFKDGTGIEFTYKDESGSLKDIHAVYGTLDVYGRVLEPLNDLIITRKYISLAGQDGKPLGTDGYGINGIEINNDINNIGKESDLLTYLKMLNNDNFIIFISIKDEGVRYLDDKSLQFLKELGLKTEFSDKYHYAYYAIIENGTVITEECEKAQIDTSGSIPSENIQYAVTSAGYNDGNVSSIILNETEYSRNERGLNIVVYDSVRDKVLDSVAFDTHVADLTCKRW